ncbi:MAG: hypothetical protein AAFV07_19160 [Bacteroidota bacterium]
MERFPSSWLLASGRNEVVLDGPSGTHSPFAQELFELLETYKLEGVPVIRLIDHLTENVSYNARQTPIGEPIFNVGHRGGQFVFWPRNPRKPLPESITRPSKPESNSTLTPETNPAPNPDTQIKHAVYQLIRKSKVEKALDTLDKWVFAHQPDLIVDIISLQGQQAMQRRDYINGTLRGVAKAQAESTLVAQILAFVQDLP